MSNTKKIMMATAVAALFATPVSADPLTDFLDSIFQQPHSHPVAKVSRKHKRKVVSHYEQENRGFINNEASDGQRMVASYYGGGEKLNDYTANGQRFNPQGNTAAHRSLPFGTHLRVCLHGCTTVTINDRGPALYTGRSLDLSRGAASRIGMIGSGVASVKVSRLD